MPLSKWSLPIFVPEFAFTCFSQKILAPSFCGHSISICVFEQETQTFYHSYLNKILWSNFWKWILGMPRAVISSLCVLGYRDKLKVLVRPKETIPTEEAPHCVSAWCHLSSQPPLGHSAVPPHQALLEYFNNFWYHDATEWCPERKLPIAVHHGLPFLACRFQFREALATTDSHGPFWL